MRTTTRATSPVEVCMTAGRRVFRLHRSAVTNSAEALGAARDASAVNGATTRGLRRYGPPVGRRAAGYMMSALARRAGAEDRLTELFACVLAADAPFCGALLDRLGLGDCHARLVETQVRTGVGQRTLDMKVAVASGDRLARELWSEHKLDAEFGLGQLDDYEVALEARRARGDLVDFRCSGRFGGEVHRGSSMTMRVQQR